MHPTSEIVNTPKGYIDVTVDLNTKEITINKLGMIKKVPTEFDPKKKNNDQQWITLTDHEDLVIYFDLYPEYHIAEFCFPQGTANAEDGIYSEGIIERVINGYHIIEEKEEQVTHFTGLEDEEDERVRKEGRKFVVFEHQDGSFTILENPTAEKTGDTSEVIKWMSMVPMIAETPGKAIDRFYDALDQVTAYNNGYKDWKHILHMSTEEKEEAFM